MNPDSLSSLSSFAFVALISVSIHPVYHRAAQDICSHVICPSRTVPSRPVRIGFSIQCKCTCVFAFAMRMHMGIWPLVFIRGQVGFHNVMLLFTGVGPALENAIISYPDNVAILCVPQVIFGRLVWRGQAGLVSVSLACQ